MDKSLFNYAKRLISKHRGEARVELPINSLLPVLVQHYNFAQIIGNKVVFTIDGMEKLKTLCRQDGYDLLRDYPSARSRMQNADEGLRNEKNNALPVTQDFILLNSLQPLKLNAQLIPASPINSLGQYLNVNDINSVEHKQIVLVENLAVMACLRYLQVPDELKNALWIYRGDIKPQQQTGTAYAFFRRWKKSRQLICFPDFDPEGLLIAHSSKADDWLAPKQQSWQQILTLVLTGPENEWHKQQDAKKWLHKQQAILPPAIISASEYMNQAQKTLKQEHMLSHKVALELLSLK